MATARASWARWRLPAGGPLVAWALCCAIGAGAFVLTAYDVSPFALPGALAGVALLIAAFRRPDWGVAAALGMIPLELFAVTLPSGALSATEAALAVVAVAWLCRALVRPGTVVLPSLRDAPIVILLGTIVAGVTVAAETGPVLRVFVLWLLFYFVYLQVQSFSPAQIRRILIVFAVSAGVLGVVGALDFLRSGHMTLYEGGLLTAGRATGTFSDPNYFASILALAVAPAIALALRDVRRNGWLIVPAAAAGAGVAFSLSRGGALALAVALLTLLLWARARKAVLVFAVALGVVALTNAQLITGSRSYATVTERLGTIDRTLLTRTNPRPRIWATAIAVAEEHPFIGVGTGQFATAAGHRGLTEYGSPLENVHNLPLNFAAETGVVGFAAFVTFVLQWLVRAVRAIRVSDRLRYSIAVGMLASLLGFLVQAMTLTQLRVNVIAGTFFVFGGIVTALADRARADMAAGRDATVESRAGRELTVATAR